MAKIRQINPRLNFFFLEDYRVKFLIVNPQGLITWCDPYSNPTQSNRTISHSLSDSHS